MSIEKLFLSMILSVITLLELLILVLFYWILPFLIFLLTILGLLAYKIFQYIIIRKRRLTENITYEISDEMKAIIYSKSILNLIEYGDYIPSQIFSDYDILIKVNSASLNPVDYKINYGKIPFYRWYLFPEVGIGFDLSGEVISIGSKVTKFKVGDIVFGFASSGTFQEYALSNERYLSFKPNNLSFQECAALPLAGCTCYQGLTHFVKKNKYDNTELNGKTVLVIGCSGGTGHLGVQIAKGIGADKVYGVCSSKNVDTIKNLNVCDEVFSYDNENFETELENCFGESKVDIILDTVSSWSDGDLGKQYKKYLKSYSEEGRYIYLNHPNLWKWTLAILARFLKKIKFEKEGEHLVVINKKRAMSLERIRDLAENNKIKPIIKEMDFNKENVLNGIEELKSRRTVGKLVYNILTKN